QDVLRPEGLGSGGERAPQAGEGRGSRAERGEHHPGQGEGVPRGGRGMDRAPASSIPREALLRAGLGARPAAARRARRRARNVAGYLFISPWLVGFFTLTLLPIAASLYFAFTHHDILTPPRWTGLQNFRRMFFGDPRYLQAVAVTAFYVAVAVPLRLAGALAVAMVLNTHRRGVSVYRAAYYAPSVVAGSVAVAVMWRQVF